MIPITIITGFLGSGKTTLINKIIKENPQYKFGLIINEFGEVGIDGKIIDNPTEEILEMSDGCLCCVVRSDLIEAVEKMVNSGKVNYILIETSGLAEPAPILDTFATLSSSTCFMDSLLTVVDVINFDTFASEYKTAVDQLKLGDVIILNKTESLSKQEVEDFKLKVKTLNPQSSILINDEQTATSLFIETNAWNTEKLLELSKKHSHSHHSHHDHSDHKHEHTKVDEVVWKTEKELDPNKMDAWLDSKFPQNAIRAKGILKIKTQNGPKLFVFQMVGANKTLTPLESVVSKDMSKDILFSSLVFIGKHLDQDEIYADLESITE